MNLTHLVMFKFWAGASPTAVTQAHSAIDSDWLYSYERQYLPGTNTVGTVAANFKSDTTSNPPTVQFTSTSVGATSWLWDFGDGTGASTVRNPSYTYTVTPPSEDFTVVLSINAGADITFKVVTVASS